MVNLVECSYIALFIHGASTMHVLSLNYIRLRYTYGSHFSKRFISAKKKFASIFIIMYFEISKLSFRKQK